ncbi:phage tail protein [Nocardioides alcanivorans]|uniref:phage tail protein n=1 Tax=Nocardioides alcanivorans TaxID=2897352 RepID=UPI001F313454|nr:hypothetical protein [Nocardioides alcanivorans]
MIALGLVVAEQVVPAIAAIFSKAVEFEGVLVPLAAALGAGVLAFKAYALAVAAVAAVQKIWLGVQVALNVALTANPIGLVVAALAALAVGLVVAYKRSETFRNIVNGVFAKVRAAAQAFASGAKKAFQTVVSALDAMQDGVSRGVSAILGWFRQLPGQILGALGGLGGLLRKAGASVIDGFLGGMKKAWGGLVSWVGGLGTRIRGVIGDLGRLLYDIGVGIMDGLLSGIKAGWGKVSSFAGSVAGEVKGIFKGDFKINSPAKLIIPIGMSVIEGLQVGMVTQAKKLTKTTSSITKGVKKFFTTDIKKIGPAMVKSMKSMLKSLQQQLNKATKRVDLFKSIRDQVKSAFAPDLFSGSLKDFLSGVGTQLAGNKAVLAAFPKLLKKGLKGDFLTALMGSGNTQLILGLAGADSSALKGLQSDWNEMNSIAGKLGTNVAQTQVGSSLKSLEKKADKLNSLVEKLDKRIGKAVGNELNKGARKGKKAKKK